MPNSKINGIELHYEIHGEGEPLLLIMGLGMDRRGWMFQVPFFSQHYKTIVFDNRGVGQSSKPSGAYTTKMLAEDASALLDALQIQTANIVGISMGGMISQQLALNFPQKVKKLVLGCTYAVPEKEMDDLIVSSIKTLFGNGNLTVEQIAASKNVDMKLILPYMMSLTLSPSFIEKNKALIDMMVEEVLREGLSVEGFFGQLQAVRAHDTLSELHKIKSPALVITGDEDRLIPPRCSDEIASRIQGAKLVKIKGGSHGFNFEQPDLFNSEVLSFLNGKG